MTATALTIADLSVWQRFLEYPFYQNALLGGAAIALMCSVLSVFVVLKRMAFIGQGITHAAFGGVGAALLAGLFLEGLRPVLARDAIIAGFCVAAAVAIGYLSRRERLTEDTAIGIVLVSAMALGLILLDVRGHLLEQLVSAGKLQRGQMEYTPSFHDILFGNILFIQRDEVYFACALAALVLAGVVAFYKELVFFAFDEEAARVFGVPTTALYYALLVLLGLAVVVAMRSLGVILASALLILPGASGRMLSSRVGRVMLLSAALGVAGLVGGLFLAIYFRFLSAGAVIVLTLCAIFAASYGCRCARRRFRRRPDASGQQPS